MKRECEDCGGSGQLWVIADRENPDNYPPEMLDLKVNCWRCDGSGVMDDYPRCQDCGGRGRIVEDGAEYPVWRARDFEKRCFRCEGFGVVIPEAWRRG